MTSELMCPRSDLDARVVVVDFGFDVGHRQTDTRKRFRRSQVEHIGHTHLASDEGARPNVIRRHSIEWIDQVPVRLDDDR